MNNNGQNMENPQLYTSFHVLLVNKTISMSVSDTLLKWKKDSRQRE